MVGVEQLCETEEDVGELDFDVWSGAVDFVGVWARIAGDVAEYECSVVSLGMSGCRQ